MMPVRSGWRIVLRRDAGTRDIKRVQECESRVLQRLQRHLTERDDYELRKWRVLPPGDMTPQKVPYLNPQQLTSLADAISDEIVARLLQRGQIGTTRRQKEAGKTFLEQKGQRE